MQFHFSFQSTSRAHNIRFNAISLAALAALSSAHTTAIAQAQPSQAAITNTSGDITQLDAVVVSASREGTSIKQTPAAISKLDGQTIAETKATFTGEVLNKAAGVYMVNLGNEQHSMSIRQPITYSAKYLYMEDGIPVRPIGVFNHNALYEVNMTGAESVEVMKGPASSLYGNNAVGGAVNFITKPASAKEKGHLGFQLTDANFQRLDYGVSYVSGNHGIRLSGYSSHRGKDWHDYNKADKNSFTLRHDWGVSDASVLTTVLTYNQLDTDMPGSVKEQYYRSKPGYSENTFTGREVEAIRVSSKLEGEWNENGQTSITVFARSNSTEQVPSYRIRTNRRTGQTSGLTTSQKFTSFGFDAKHRQDFPASQLRWIVGASYDRSPVKNKSINTVVTRDAATGKNIAYRKTTVARDYDVTVQSQAVYSQLEFKPTKNTTIVAGGRYDDIQYDHTNHLTPSPRTGAPSGTRSFNHFSPKLGIVWNATPLVSVYGNISQGFAPPEQGAVYGALSVPDIEEETYNNYDLGVRWSSADRSFSGDVGIYRLDGNNEIVSFEVAPRTYERRNTGKTRHQGIEFSLNKAFNDQWSARLSGSYSTHKYVDFKLNQTGKDYSGNDMLTAPKWLANAQVDYRINKQWKLTAEAQHVGSYYMDDANTATYPGHTVVHLMASYQHNNWQFWAKLRNLENKRYAESARKAYGSSSYVPGDPRTLLLGARYTF